MKWKDYFSTYRTRDTRRWMNDDLFDMSSFLTAASLTMMNVLNAPMGRMGYQSIHLLNRNNGRKVARRLMARSDLRLANGWAIQTRSVSTGSDSENQQEVTRQDLLDEAAALTKSLYRICLRSVKVIRWGNEFDDKEFEKREEEFANPTAGGMLSMAPPPNREDELRSRAEYYQSYTREYFIQESDCLDNDPLREKDINRYLYYLRKGDKDRRWLLGDMMFPDPYKNALDQERIKKFEEMGKKYLGIADEPEKQPVDESIDDFFDADDEDPEWFKKKYPNLR